MRFDRVVAPAALLMFGLAGPGHAQLMGDRSLTAICAALFTSNVQSRDHRDVIARLGDVTRALYDGIDVRRSRARAAVRAVVFDARNVAAADQTVRRDGAARLAALRADLSDPAVPSVSFVLEGRGQITEFLEKQRARREDFDEQLWAARHTWRTAARSAARATGLLLGFAAWGYLDRHQYLAPWVAQTGFFVTGAAALLFVRARIHDFVEAVRGPRAKPDQDRQAIEAFEPLVRDYRRKDHAIASSGVHVGLTDLVSRRFAARLTTATSIKDFDAGTLEELLYRRRRPLRSTIFRRLSHHLLMDYVFVPGHRAQASLVIATLRVKPVASDAAAE